MTVNNGLKFDDIFSLSKLFKNHLNFEILDILQFNLIHSLNFVKYDWLIFN